MHFKARSILEDKSILILGFGKEGQSTYTLLREWFPDKMLGIADRDKSACSGLNDRNASFITGDAYLDCCSEYDLVIKSPGIPYDLVKGHCDADRITSQTDLFLRAYSDQVIGVTGTKGKSTVSSLIYHILKTSGQKAALAGNIGIPPLGLLKDITDDSVIVFEMSSHQLEHISIAPKVAVILNLYPEHLDHYKDFTAYKMAKFNIGLLQEEGGTLVFNFDDPIIGELVKGQNSLKRMLSFSLNDSAAGAYAEDGVIHVNTDNKQFSLPVDSLIDLPGKHNLMNTLAAALVCADKGVDKAMLIKGIETYTRLEHRLEFAGVFNGISFYNDSIATIPEACIEALNTLEKTDLLILGGYDRDLDYSRLYRAFDEHHIPFLVFMGDAGKRMKREFVSTEYAEYSPGMFSVDDMAGAFHVIREKLGKGDVCLLSPAAASYGMFRNFEERGDIYKKMAAAL